MRLPASLQIMISASLTDPSFDIPLLPEVPRKGVRAHHGFHECAQTIGVVRHPLRLLTTCPYYPAALPRITLTSLNAGHIIRKNLNVNNDRLSSMMRGGNRAYRGAARRHSKDEYHAQIGSFRIF